MFYSSNEMEENSFKRFPLKIFLLSRNIDSKGNYFLRLCYMKKKNKTFYLIYNLILQSS